MKLCRINTADGTRPAAIDADGITRDLSNIVEDLTTTQVSPIALAELASIDLTALPEITGTPAPFLADPGRVFCIGLNFYDHAEEMGMPIPENPILFMKACPVTAANDPIIIPKGSEKTDWEVELGVLIGSRAQHVDEDSALDHVAGYFVANDVSERHFQMELGGQWIKGKSADSFAPVGPFFATADEIADPQDLAMTLRVNDQVMQSGSTKTMIFGVREIIAHLSRFLTLQPGDLILTGTPQGVGGGQKPPRFLQAGDTVTAVIAGLGQMHQQVVAFS